MMLPKKCYVSLETPVTLIRLRMIPHLDSLNHDLNDSLANGSAIILLISNHFEGVENIDLSEEVTGHLRYPDLIPKILNRCGFLDVKGGEGTIPKDDIQLDRN